MGTPAFVSQLHSMISSAGTWIASLGGVGGVTMLGYHAVMRNFNDDPQHVAHHTASMKKVLVGTAIVAGAGSIAAFFGHML